VSNQWKWCCPRCKSPSVTIASDQTYCGCKVPGCRWNGTVNQLVKLSGEEIAEAGWVYEPVKMYEGGGGWKKSKHGDST
jgi:hypothetical protein